MNDQSATDTMLAYMANRTLTRARELKVQGVSGTAISRAVASGVILRVGRGLYQLPDADIDTHISLVEVATQAPKAVICLISALSFHGLTDQLPRKVWIAIGTKDWAPKSSSISIRPVRFREPYFSNGIETHTIGGVDVRLYSVSKSIADAFRNPKLVDRSVAIECLKSALETRRATVGDIAHAASQYGVAKRMGPYLEALSANG